ADRRERVALTTELVDDGADDGDRKIHPAALRSEDMSAAASTGRAVRRESMNCRAWSMPRRPRVVRSQSGARRARGGDDETLVDGDRVGGGDGGERVRGRRRRDGGRARERGAR